MVQLPLFAKSKINIQNWMKTQFEKGTNMNLPELNEKGKQSIFYDKETATKKVTSSGKAGQYGAKIHPDRK